MNVLPIHAALRRMQDGDAILYEGVGIVPWLIKKRTDKTHASMVIRNDYSLYDNSIPHEIINHTTLVDIVETTGGPVEYKNLYNKLMNYKGEAYWLPTNMNTQQRLKCKQIAQQMVVKQIPYDFKGLIKNWCARVNMDLAKLWCSELVVAIWYQAMYINDTTLNRPGDLSKLIDREPIKLLLCPAENVAV